MLYATTRSDHDTYTAQRALKELAAPDGGLYLPMRLEKLSRQELDALLEMTNPEICAFLINHFFSTRLTARDVEFLLGRKIARLEQMSHRITIAQCWHNPEGDFARTERILAKLAAVDKRETPVGQWLKVVSRICLLFGLFAQLNRQGDIGQGSGPDVAVPTDDYTAPVAAWYARQMGLPVGNILCCCNENDGLWELLQTGQIRMDPDRPVAPGMEQLIRLCLGSGEARRFMAARQEGGSYQVSKTIRNPFAGIYASVISNRRIPGVISNVYATNGYILCPDSAVLHAGLMDYRARTGIAAPALMISLTSPLRYEDTVAKALSMTPEQLREHLNMM